MGVRTISDERDRMSALYDSVTELAFGPLFHNDEGSADEFLDWFNERSFSKHIDLRSMHPDSLAQTIREWHKARDADQAPLPFPEIPF